MKQAQGYQSKPDNFFLTFVSIFKNNVAVKLTIAPKKANMIVFAKSSECKFGKMLNKVPAAVPAFREILVPIARIIFSFLERFCRIFHSNLAYCR